LMTLTLCTSGALRIVADQPLLDAQGRTFCYLFDDTQWLIGGPTSSAGAVLDKIFELVLPEVPQHERFTRAVSLAAEVQAGAEGLTVLPFLSGERAPYWRGDLRGALFGLDLAHDRRHILRGAFEGVVFALYGVYAVMRELGIQPRAIVLSGGLTHATFVRQMIADVFEIEARFPDRREASAFGAAMFAGIASRAIASLDDVATRIRYPETYAPQAANQAAYRAARQRFEARIAAELKVGA
ncbi:MAG: FGGY-family carbohydrate kinase, partial [Vulcanimicrobiaceae bacterium]